MADNTPNAFDNRSATASKPTIDEKPKSLTALRQELFPADLKEEMSATAAYERALQLNEAAVASGLTGAALARELYENYVLAEKASWKVMGTANNQDLVAFEQLIRRRNTIEDLLITMTSIHFPESLPISSRAIGFRQSPTPTAPPVR